MFVAMKNRDVMASPREPLHDVGADESGVVENKDAPRTSPLFSSKAGPKKY